MRRAANNPEEGFTLIELLVSLVVLGVFILLAMPSFSAWLMNSKIRTTAESIVNGLQVARNEAVQRNATVEFVLGAGSSWTVRCAVVAPACPDMNPIQTRATGEGSSSTITVTPSHGNTIIFNNLGLMTSPAVGVNDVVRFDVDGPSSAAADSRELRVTIRSGGNVRLCDPNVTGADPRAC